MSLALALFVQDSIGRNRFASVRKSQVSSTRRDGRRSRSTFSWSLDTGIFDSSNPKRLWFPRRSEPVDPRSRRPTCGPEPLSSA